MNMGVRQQGKWANGLLDEDLPPEFLEGRVPVLLKWITALVVELGKDPEVRELPNNLKAFELTIQSYIETVESLRPGCLIVYDGGYPLSQKPPKREDIHGVFIIIRAYHGELVSLSAEDIAILSEAYKYRK